MSSNYGLLQVTFKTRTEILKVWSRAVPEMILVGARGVEGEESLGGSKKVEKRLTISIQRLAQLIPYPPYPLKNFSLTVMNTNQHPHLDAYGCIHTYIQTYSTYTHTIHIHSTNAHFYWHYNNFTNSIDFCCFFDRLV